MTLSESSGARAPWWLWPHVLSLEAPLVAVAWTQALAALHQVPVMPGVLAGLGLAVWLIYVADRSLDTVGVAESLLGPRHRFYRQYRGWLLGLALPVGTAVLGWLALWIVPAALTLQTLLLALPVLAYLVVYTAIGNPRWRDALFLACGWGLILLVTALPVSWQVRGALSLLIFLPLMTMLRWRLHERIPVWVHKEAVAGLLFALGCTQWTRFLALNGIGVDGSMEVLLLALLFSSNLSLISRQEGTAIGNRESPWGSLIVTGLTVIATFLAVGVGELSGRLVGLAAAVGLGTGLLAVLQPWAAKLSPEAFRVLTDLAVLLPALLLLVVC